MSCGIRRASAALFCCVLGCANANAADVTITDAKIEGGKLVVTGTTATPSMNLTLDDRFTRKSSASKAFTFSLVYLPTDCIVNVGKTGATTTTPAVVANCAARGLNPQGAWSAAKSYMVDDTVTQLGSVWLALKANKNKSPSSAANAQYWEKFVSKGDIGAAGPQGATGPQGVGVVAAYVAANVTVLAGAHATGATHVGTGEYSVDFDRDVSQCFYSAATFLNAIAVDVQPRSFHANGVFLQLQDHTGAAVDNPFYLTVYCED